MRKVRVLFLIWALFALMQSGVSAQHIVLISKAGSRQHFTFSPGEDIYFQVQNSNVWQLGLVTKIAKDSVSIDDVWIKNTAFKKVDLGAKGVNRAIRSKGPYLIGASLLLLGADALNQLVFVQPSGSYTLGREVAIASFAMGALGAAAIYLPRRKVRLNGRYSFTTIEAALYYETIGRYD